MQGDGGGGLPSSAAYRSKARDRPGFVLCGAGGAEVAQSKDRDIQGDAMKRRIRITALVALALATAGVFAQGQAPQLPDAAATDPKALGWMVGSPPPPDKIIRFADGSFYKFPQWRWTFSNARQFLPTANVSRGSGGIAVLPNADRNDLDAIEFTTMEGRKMTWLQSLPAVYTDGIVVLHKGNIVYERYFGALEPVKPHSAMSVTKSFVGTLAAMLAAEGVIDPSAPVTRYLPELKDTAYGDATVRQVMDMTIGVKYSENYADPKAEVWDYSRAGGMLPTAPDYKGPRNYYEFLVRLQKEGNHGEAFAYKTVNSEVLAWIVTRVTGRTLAQLTSERIWSKLGAEGDAFYSVDSIGTASGGGGLSTTLRDLARFGEMMRLGGFYNGQQIVPKAVVEDIQRGASREDFAKAGYKTLPGWSYRNMWWISHNENGAYTARGIHGQVIWIDPKAEMVIARYASHAVPNNPFNDPVSLPAYAAMAKKLMGE